MDVPPLRAVVKSSVIADFPVGHWLVEIAEVIVRIPWAVLCRPNRLVVRTTRCGRVNPGSNPGSDIVIDLLVALAGVTSLVYRLLPALCRQNLPAYRLPD